MTCDWRRLTLAALVAGAVACAGISHVAAQAPAKQAAQKAPAKEAQDGEEEAAKKAPAKKKRQDPAEAQRAIDAAAKLLETGKAEPAAQSLSTVLSGGNLPPAIMAKALLYRGIAYRQQKKPAQAIADLTSALWLKGGLGEADRKDALRQRTSAYQEAGLSDNGEPIAPAMPGASRGTTRTASASGVSDDGSPSAAQQEAQAPQQGSGWSLSNPFSGWFGSSSSNPAPQQPSPPPTTASIEPSPPVPRPASSGWSRNTEVRGSGAATPAAVTVAARPEGRFRIQVGMARTQADAQALAMRVKRDHADVLSMREPEIDETVVGNMGSFYRVRIGPFASAPEGQAACAKLKGPGIDCLVVTQ
jgi:SPOR domain